MKPRKYFSVPVTIEAISAFIKESGVDLPDDAILIKIVSSSRADLVFDFIFRSQKRGWMIAEGQVIPRGMRIED